MTDTQLSQQQNCYLIYDTQLLSSTTTYDQKSADDLFYISLVNTFLSMVYLPSTDEGGSFFDTQLIHVNTQKITGCSLD